MKMRKLYIRIHDLDNVAVALSPLSKGENIRIGKISFKLKEDVPAGHKFSLALLEKNEIIIKYGAPIGHALVRIEQGEWVSTRNIVTNLSSHLEYEYCPVEISSYKKRNGLCSFKGFRRKNGSVGIRNEVWIIPTVGCVNGIAERLARKVYEGKPDCVDSVVAYPHNFGCSQLGDDHENTRKILRNMVVHPNAGGVLLIGLGCENNRLSSFLPMLGDFDSKRIKYIECQKSDDELEDGVELLQEIFDEMSGDRREDIPVSELKVGLKCGGSDGFSGITANPLVGRFSDFLISRGGSAVLTEVPEMFGAENLLMNRCKDESVFKKTVELINNFKDYFVSNNQPVYENPSPGNKDGGISTLEEKSLGCTQKSGSSEVVDVLDYGDRIRRAGLSLLNAPGNDLVASTALAASGCQLILFTTGRGTPFGTFVPTLKISTNSALYEAKRNWIDYDAGVLLDDIPMEQLCEELVRKIIDTANGAYTCNEKNGYRDFALFKTGVTL